MASTSKQYSGQLQTGPLIPPDFGASNFPLPAPSHAGSNFLQQSMPLGDVSGPRPSAGMEAANSPLYGGGLMGVHQNQNFGGISHPQPFAQVQKPSVPVGANIMRERYPGAPGPGAPGTGVGNPVSPQMPLHHEPNPGLHQPTRLNFGGMPHQNNQVPLQRNAFNAPQSQFGHPESGLQNLMGMEQSRNARRSAFESTDAPVGSGLWNQRGPTEAPNQAAARPSDPYYLNSLQLQGQGPQRAAALPTWTMATGNSTPRTSSRRKSRPLRLVSNLTVWGPSQPSCAAGIYIWPTAPRPPAVPRADPSAGVDRPVERCQRYQ